MKINLLRPLIMVSKGLLCLFLVQVFALQFIQATPLMSANPDAIDISGTVTDENGEPIPGATVIVEGTNIGTVTDIDGNFNINAEVGNVIQISFIGYETQQISVGNQTRYNISLTPILTEYST